MNLWLALGAMSLVAFGTRLLPFWVGGSLGKSAVTQRLSRMLLPCILILLIAHCVHEGGKLSCEFLSIAIVVLVHLLWRKDLLSIGVGTCAYLFLTRVI